MLPKKNRLKKGFTGTLRFGKKLKGKYFVVIYRSHQDTYPRFGILITRKIGGAVVRNRIKRRVRQVIISNSLHKTGAVDIVIIPSKFVPNWNDVSFEAIETDLLNILREL